METNPKQVLMMALAASGTTFLAWVGNNILEGAEQKGYNKAKNEVNESYNEAIRDAITYRAMYDICCSVTGADSTAR